MPGGRPSGNGSDATKNIIVALVGRPNCGKTSLLTRLTGVKQRAVNFPGTSVERNEGSVRVGAVHLRVVDLPGISSVHALSRDEEPD